MSEENQACCACLSVEFAPVENDDGTLSERWVCRNGCGAEFVRRAKVDALQERIRNEQEENLRDTKKHEGLVKKLAAQRARIAELEEAGRIYADDTDETIDRLRSRVEDLEGELDELNASRDYNRDGRERAERELAEARAERDAALRDCHELERGFDDQVSLVATARREALEQAADDCRANQRRCEESGSWEAAERWRCRADWIAERALADAPTTDPEAEDEP